MADLKLRDLIPVLGSNSVSGMAQALGMAWPPPSPISLRDFFRKAFTAFVLSGGGAKGSFEVGALKYLYGHGIRPRILCTTSVGSVNGLKLSEGEGGPTRGFAGLESIWLNMKFNTDMWVEDSWFATTPAWIRQAIESSGDKPGWLQKLLLLLLPGLAAEKLKDLSDFVETASVAHGIYNLGPIESLARQNIDLSVLGNIRLRMAAVALGSGEIRYTSEKGRLLMNPALPSDDPNSPEVDVVKGMLASAAIPVFFEMQKLDDDWYVDGGLRQVAPVEAAVAMGAKEIFAIVAPVPLVDDGDYTNKGLPDIGVRSATDITIDEILTDNIEPFGGWPIPVHIIRPNIEVESSRTIDPGLIRINIAYGFMRAFDVLGNTRGFITRDNSDQIAFLRNDIWTAENTLYYDALQVNWITGSPGRPADPGWYARVKGDVAAVREKKKQLVPLLQFRVDLVGNSSMTQDASDWVVMWEAHQWDPNENLIDPRAGQFLFPPNPWGQFHFEIEGQTILDILAETPPKV